MSETTRRAVLTGAAGIGAAAALAACGSNATDTSPGGADTTNGAGAASSGPPAAGASSKAATGNAGAGISTADIPVGGGKVLADQKVVVTQPTAGEFKAFSAICTHTGCPVTSVTAGVINCACHGSQFSAVDGTVKKGPATKPLAAANVTISRGQITVT